MLSLTGTAVAVNPDTELRAIARSRGWTSATSAPAARQRRSACRRSPRRPWPAAWSAARSPSGGATSCPGEGHAARGAAGLARELPAEGGVVVVHRRIGRIRHEERQELAGGGGRLEQLAPRPQVRVFPVERRLGRRQSADGFPEVCGREREGRRPRGVAADRCQHGCRQAVDVADPVDLAPDELVAVQPRHPVRHRRDVAGNALGEALTRGGEFLVGAPGLGHRAQPKTLRRCSSSW